MINSHRRHRLRGRNVDLSSPLMINVLLQGQENHRSNVVWRRLQETADEQQIVLGVAQQTSIGNEAQQSRQPVSPLQILSPAMSRSPLLSISLRLSSNPGANRCQQPSRRNFRLIALRALPFALLPFCFAADARV